MLSITLSAWGFAGLAGNQMAALIVKHFGEEVVIDGNTVNPTGYQYVLYATLILYVISLLVSIFLVKPSEAGEAVHDH